MYYHFIAAPFVGILDGKNSFWVSLHHVMYTEVVLTWFGAFGTWF